MNASKSINIKIAIILTAKINRIILKEIFADYFVKIFITTQYGDGGKNQR